MIKIFLFFMGLLSFSSAPLAAGVVGVDSDELRSLQDKGAIVVDVRTPKEWQETGVIPGSHPLTFFDANGHYDKAAWLQSLKPLLEKSDQPIVLVCRSGHRSATVGKFLVTEAGFAHVYTLEKGLRAWSAEGRPLSPPCWSALECAPIKHGVSGAAP